MSATSMVTADHNRDMLLALLSRNKALEGKVARSATALWRARADSCRGALQEAELKPRDFHAPPVLPLISRSEPSPHTPSAPWARSGLPAKRAAERLVLHRQSPVHATASPLCGTSVRFLAAYGIADGLLLEVTDTSAVDCSEPAPRRVRSGLLVVRLKRRRGGALDRLLGYIGRVVAARGAKPYKRGGCTARSVADGASRVWFARREPPP
ncbi:hypothetical protein MTO96_022947 [Rhipicephalus appendiculatus]